MNIFSRRVSSSLDPNQADVLSGLISIHTVRKGYLQTTLVATSRERVKMVTNFENVICYKFWLCVTR